MLKNLKIKGKKFKVNKQILGWHEEDKIIVYEKGDLLFVYNFHPTKSFENYKIGTKWDSDHIILFETDSK